MRKTEPVLFNLLLVVGCYVLVSPFVWIVTDDFFHFFLIWNMTLAVMPVLFAWLLARRKIRRTWLAVAAAVLWLAFLPNALYIVTDLLYLSEHNFVFWTGPYATVIYLDDFTGWLALFHIAAGAFVAAYAGTWSLVLMMRVGRRYIKKGWTDLLAVAVAVVSGVGIYIGRFFRYNSWNLARIFDIARELVDALSRDMIGFILTAAVLQIGLLVLLYPAFTHDSTRTDDR